MSNNFDEYRSEIEENEQTAFQRWVESGNRENIGTSFWENSIQRLRDIQLKHGICADDPRISSIGAYLKECERIDRSPPDEDGLISIRTEFARACCMARFFPGLNELHPATVDSVPALWRYAHHLLGIRDFQNAQRKDASVRSSTTEPDVQKLYTFLHKMQIPFAPRPEYGSFTREEARDEIQRIANELEKLDMERSEKWRHRSVKRKSAGDQQPENDGLFDSKAFEALVTEPIVDLASLRDWCEKSKEFIRRELKRDSSVMMSSNDSMVAHRLNVRIWNEAALYCPLIPLYQVSEHNLPYNPVSFVLRDLEKVLAWCRGELDSDESTVKTPATVTEIFQAADPKVGFAHRPQPMKRGIRFPKMIVAKQSFGGRMP